jgi:hypothetical protein
MNQNLFGETVPEKKPHLSRWLERQDAATFGERLLRAQYVHSIYPNTGFLLPPESFYVMNEAGQAFINGQDVATVMLSQAFIEHILQIHLENGGHPAVAQRGLKAIIKHVRETEPQHEYVMGLVDEVRKVRNPFSHLRDFEDPDSLTQRVMRTQTMPEQVLEDEAKRALAVMYQIAVTRF